MSLTIRPLHPLFAAEISGVEVCRAADEPTFAQIRAALDEHSVVVFRDQALNDDGHVAFSRRFGPLETTVKGNTAAGTHFARQSNLDVETGEVIPAGDRRLAYLKAARFWHTDSSFKAVPSLCSLLAGYIVPPEGGNTEFATARAAYEALPDAMKARVEGLVAEHSQMHSLGLVDPGIITEEMRAELPVARHPLVRTNPVNGRRNLFLGTHAFRIMGMPDEEGLALIKELNALIVKPVFVYSHRWSAGDLVVWDNRCVLHRATPYDSVKYRRLLQRTTVAGSEADYRREPAVAAMKSDRANLVVS